MISRFIAFFLIATFTLFSFLSAQEANNADTEAAEPEILLELPGFSKNSQPNNPEIGGLKLLSPHELQGLYTDTPSPNEASPPETINDTAPPAAPSETTEITPAVAPPPIEPVDSYAELVENLESESNDQTTEKYDINNVWSYRSLMLHPNESNLLSAAITRYLKSKNEPIVEVMVEPEPIINEETGEIEEEMIVADYPFIYVNSIMYFSENNWAAWINGKKYSPEEDEVLPGLKLKSVTKSKVYIQWKRPENILQDSVNDMAYMDPADANFDDPMAGNPTISPNADIMDAPPMPLDEIAPSATAEPITEVAEEEITLPDEVIDIGDDVYIVGLSPNQLLITETFAMHEGRVATKEIRRIYQKVQANKSQQMAAQDQPIPAANAGMEGIPEEVDPATATANAIAERDKENLSKLLQLYKESGLGNSELDPNSPNP